MANHAHPHKYTEGTVLMSKGKQERRYALLPQSEGVRVSYPLYIKLRKVIIMAVIQEVWLL